MEYATLQNGLKMPMEGFGVFQVRDKEECKRSVLDAIRTGYRLIDTAASYTNEDAVGEAVREAIAEGICTREELFITSKMWVQDMQNYEMAKAAIGASLEKTGLEYLDACGIIGLNQESPINTGFERFGPFSLTRKAG